MRKHLTVEQRYAMDLAQRKAEAREKGKRRRCLFTETAKEQAKEMLERKLSPEQVAGRCKVGGIEMMPYETLYKWAWKGKHTGGRLHAHLRRQEPKYRLRGVAKAAGASFGVVWTYRKERRLWGEKNG